MGTRLLTDCREITPAMAAELLQRNKNNRPLREKVVDRYAADMLAGGWKVTGEAIKIDRNGNLADGQHRLSAVIRSGVTILSVIIFDVEPDSRPYMDGGIPRTRADQLTMLGYKNAHRTSTLCRLLYSWEEGRSLGTHPSRSPSLAEIEAVYGRWAAIPNGLSLSWQCSRHGGGIAPSALALFFTLAYTVSPDSTSDFAVHLSTGAGLDIGHPVLHLRNHLASQLARGVKVKRHQHVAWLTQAWMALRQNRKRKRYSRCAPLATFPGLVKRTEQLA